MGTHQNPWNPLSEEIVVSALKLILDPKNYPLLVMCGLGRHRTGTVIGCLRKLQRWNLTSIFDEYRRYAGNKVRLGKERKKERKKEMKERKKEHFLFMPSSHS
jgi:tyrosine-protein phosphatase OCA1